MKMFRALAVIAVLGVLSGCGREEAPKPDTDGADSPAPQQQASGVEEALQAIRDKGEPVSTADLVAWYQNATPSPNSASAWLDAFEVMQPASGATATALPIEGQGALPGYGKDFRPEIAFAIKQFLDANERAIAKMKAAVRIGPAQFPVDPSLGGAVQTPHLGPVTAAGRLLALEAIYRASQKDRSAAHEALLAGFTLAASMNNEVYTIGFYAGQNVLMETLRAAEYTLGYVPYDDTLYGELAKAIGAVRDPKAAYRAMAGDRAMILAAFQAQDTASLGLADRPTPGEFPVIIKELTILVDAARAEPPEGMRLFRERATSPAAIPATLPMAQTIVPHYKGYVEARAVHDALLRTAELAIALARHKLAYENVPADPEKLVPTFLPAVPNDPFDGQPLRFSHSDMEIRAYSVGPNGLDDRGRDARHRGGSIQDSDIAFVIVF